MLADTSDNVDPSLHMSFVTSLLTHSLLSCIHCLAQMHQKTLPRGVGC